MRNTGLSPLFFEYLTITFLVSSIVIKLLFYILMKSSKKKIKLYFTSFISWYGKMQRKNSSSRSKRRFMLISNLMNITFWIGFLMIFFIFLRKDTDDELKNYRQFLERQKPTPNFILKQLTVYNTLFSE